MTPTVHVILKTRWRNQKGLYKIKTRGCLQREQKFLGILIPGMPNKLSIEMFKKVKSDKLIHPFSDYADKINTIESTAHKVIENMDAFSWGEFEFKFFDLSKEETNSVYCFQDYIDELKEQGRASTLASYNF